MWRVPVLIFWGTSILFHSGCTNLQSHEQWASVPFSPHPCQYSVFLNFLITTIFQPCLIWNKCLFWSSVFNRVLGFFDMQVYNSLYIVDINYLLNMWFTYIFSYSVGHLFILLLGFFLLCKSFLILCSPICLFFFCCLCFWY